MTADRIVAFFLFSLVAAVTPGPSNVLLAATGAQAGLLRGLPCLFGVSAGMGTMMFLAAYGLGSLVPEHPSLLLACRIGGSAFLLWLAWKIATAPAVDDAAAPPRRPAGFLAAAALQWVNPKAWLVSTGAIATYLQAGDDNTVMRSAGFALVFVLAALPGGLLWLVFGAAAQRLLRSRRWRRLFNMATALALAVSVAMILH